MNEIRILVTGSDAAQLMEFQTCVGHIVDIILMKRESVFYSLFEHNIEELLHAARMVDITVHREPEAGDWLLINQGTAFANLKDKQAMILPK